MTAISRTLVVGGEPDRNCPEKEKAVAIHNKPHGFLASLVAASFP